MHTKQTLCSILGSSRVVNDGGTALASYIILFRFGRFRCNYSSTVVTLTSVCISVSLHCMHKEVSHALMDGHASKRFLARARTFATLTLFRAEETPILYAM